MRRRKREFWRNRRNTNSLKYYQERLANEFDLTSADREMLNRLITVLNDIAFDGSAGMHDFMAEFNSEYNAFNMSLDDIAHYLDTGL